VFGRKKQIPQDVESARFAKYNTTQLLKMTWQLARATVRSFWLRHKLASRLIILFLVGLILFSIISPIYKDSNKGKEYELSTFNALLDEPIQLYANKLQYNPKKQQYIFNEGYTATPGEVSGDSGSPKITATFGSAVEKNAVTLTDPVNSVGITFTPKFLLGEPQKDQNRIVYPITGKNALKVYTLKGSGIKEDIVLRDAPSEDTLEFEYEISLPDGVELRAENDGSLAAYGVTSTSTRKRYHRHREDAELLKKARKNGEKSNLLFTIPAPFVVESGKKQSNARAWFSIEGTKLTLYSSGLKSASYPLSIDPTIYVETAKKLMRGNNETNVDFDTTNELIQKSQTTGARIDGWVDSTDLDSGLWDQSTATAGGFVYRAGGRVDPTMPYVVGQQSSVQASDDANFVMDMPSIRPAGDLYVAIIGVDEDGTRTADITPPSGWTEYADNGEHAAYYKEGTDQGGGNEAASYTWTNTGSSEQWVGVIIRIKGFNAGSPISGTAGTGNSASNAIPVFPTTTPSHDATLVIRAAGIDGDQPSDYTWLPNGHTKIYSGISAVGSSATSASLVVTTLDQPPLAAGATGTTTLVDDGLLDDTYSASSIAIRPATVTSGVQNAVEWAEFNASTLAIDSPNPGDGLCNGWCNNSDYDLPANRVGMSMVAYNGFLYALGGTTDGTAANSTTSVWVSKLGANGEPQLWHPSVGTPDYWFVSSNTLPAALSYTSIAAYENKLYLVGGRDTSGNSINDVYAADLLPTGDIGPWSTSGMQNLTTPGARYGHSVHVYNDTMYVIGGSNSGTLLNTVYLSKLNSDGSMNAWVQTSSFSTGRTSFGGQMTALWGAYIYLAGGCQAVTSGYCSTIASDVQLASINADGTLAPWNPILTLTNQKIGYSFIAWQNGLYRLGGCNRQTAVNACRATHQNVEYGLVNPAGDASTVSNSEPSGSGTCITPNFTNCDLPPPGDGAGQGGQMSSMVVVNNGYIYNIGGCVAPASTCSTNMSGNTSYAALNSTGQMIAPAVCPHTTYGLWCVDSTNRINGTAGLGAAGVTVFNNMIYVAGGTNSGTWQANIYRVLLNADGSLVGPWQFETFTSSGLSGTDDDARGYMYMFARANPASAGTVPGNLYMLGGCSGTGGIGCSTYSTSTIKCNIETAGSITGCTTTGQLQIDADNVTSGNQGLGLMAGTVYANRIYLVGGACANVGASAGDPCGSTYAANRKDTIYARIDGSNNIVAESGGVWQFTTAQMNPIRRRAVSFGYNGYIYSLAGYSGQDSLQDLLFAKINVSTGNIDSATFKSSGVVVTPRWDLRAIVSNGYVYAIGGCGQGNGTLPEAPSNCLTMQAEVQTFQLYNNDSGTPVNYAASANQFTTDRMGASSTIMNGYLYVAGGCTSTTDCTTATDSVQYSAIDVNGALGPWFAGGNLPFARAWGQLENAGGTLYYIGGQESTATNESADVYYTSSVVTGNPTWTGATNDLPAARTKHGASVWDNRIYVTGGLNGSAAAQTTTYVSPKLSSGGDIGSAWTTTTAFNVARSSHTTVAYANNLYVIGGYDGTNFMNDVQFASIGYKTGTITQSGTSTITGSGTSWTSAMIGSTLQYRDGEIATILTVPSTTSMTVTVTKTVTAGSGYTILDGSLSTWSYTTSLPEPIAGADGFAANGYMYLVGGRSAVGDCVPNTLQAPVSANTTIATGNNATGLGEWYETNVKYTGERYGNTVSYANGKLYTMGGACDSAPAPVNILSQTFNTDDDTHLVTMPATVDVGDLLIVFITTDGNAAIPVTPAGWTAPATSTALGNTNQVRGSVYVKDATGTEDGTTVDFDTGTSNERGAAQVYRIPAAKWDGTITNVEVASLAIAGTVNNPNPPSLNPAGWGTENTLWFSYVAGSTHTAVTTFPTSHINGYHTNTATTTNAGASVAVTQRVNAAAAEDPAAYAMASAQASAAFTVAVRPASGASNLTYTNANRTVQTSLFSQPQVAAYSRLIDTDTDVFPTSWLMNGLDNSIGAQWQARYRSMHDLDSVVTPLEDCGTTLNMATMSTWGRITNYGNVSLGDVATYTARNSAVYTTGTITQLGTTVTGSGTSWGDDLIGGVIFYADNTTATITAVNSTTSLTVSASKTIGSAQTYSAGGGNINCARYFYFSVSIDASQTFGYPEDVNRGPTIADLSLFFTSDPSKRLRHGKTFTGGEQQPLDTPCRQSVDAECPLP
jgi:N-acetylneuraminic acid mutarotase